MVPLNLQCSKTLLCYKFQILGKISALYMSYCTQHEILVANHWVLGDSWKWVQTCCEEGGLLNVDAVG